MPLASGSRLGPYEILAPLGAGGMGELYRARDTNLDHDVAVKVPRSHLSRQLIGAANSVLRPITTFGGIGLLATTCAIASPEPPIVRITSKDGTPIALECTGAGPSLVIVHGGTGDRTRWTPLFPLFASRFRVCAMDRRGHGASGDSVNYALQREAEDVAAVVNSRPGKVFLLGHSYGGVCALEASFLTDRISKLVLYEPPLQDVIDLAVVAKMERMIQAEDREQALVTFLQEIVMISPSEVTAMKARPSWPGLVATIQSSIRQIRALAGYRFDPKRMKTVTVPTLLLAGSETASPQLKRAIGSLLDTLPNRRLVVFEGQQHNAMDTVPQQFADAVATFLLSPSTVTATPGR